jgi:hypothetical protein
MRGKSFQDRFCSRPENVPPKTTTATRKWRRQFVRVPWSWIERLQKAKRVSSYRLAMVLIYEHWRTGGRPVVLSNVTMQQEGLSRRSKSNALVELETLGLIQVKRRRRRAPRVVPLQLDREPS